jgi:aldose 1-epimerase
MQAIMATERNLGDVIELCNSAGLQASFMAYGATWVSCSIPMPTGERRDLILSYDNLTAYKAQTQYVGATIGRYVNRIRRQDGSVQLHGGPDGFDRRVWTIQKVTERSVQFTLISADGDQGFAGELHASVTYTLGDDFSIKIDWQAICNKASPVCLTNHAYFNLDGEGNVLDHQLRVNADYYLPVDSVGLPTSGLQLVEQMDFDLHKPKRLKDTIRFDHAFALNDVLAAELTSGDKRVTMQLRTDQSALQVYTGNGLSPAHAGIALEPEYLPDTADDHILAPNERWYRFMECRWQIH